MRQGLAMLTLFVSALFAACAVSSEQSETRILVFGGTGQLGSDVAKALVAAEHHVTVFARATSNRNRLDGVKLHYAIGDVLDAASVEGVLSEGDFDVVIDALGRGSAGVEFYRSSARNIAASAKRYGVQQLILHGSVGAGNSAEAFGDSRIVRRMQALMSAKSDGEAAVMGSGVDYTIIRNSRLLRYGTAESGNAALYEDPLLTGSVTREGLARLTATCVLNAECLNKIYHAVDKSRGK